MEQTKKPIEVHGKRITVRGYDLGEGRQDTHDQTGCPVNRVEGITLDGEHYMINDDDVPYDNDGIDMNDYPEEALPLGPLIEASIPNKMFRLTSYNSKTQTARGTEVVDAGLARQVQTAMWKRSQERRDADE